MDQPYFATYTGCADLFIVCQRLPAFTNPGVESQHHTMEAAQNKAARLNVSALIDELEELNRNNLDDDLILALSKVSTRLDDLLRWDLGAYRIERNRAAALEAVTAQGDTENEQVA